MKSKKELGFTLAELLAVVVILLLILAIAVPNVLGAVKTSTRKAFTIDAQQLMQKILALLLKNVSLKIDDIGVESLSEYNIPSANYSDVRFASINDENYVVIIGKNTWDGLKACGTADNMKVVDEGDTVTCEHLVGPKYNASKQVNRPILVSGMTPIKWNDTEWVNTTEDDSNWYDYDERKWANAKTADGSMWVWIPRYIYKISSGWHSNVTGTIDAQFSKGVDDNWNSSTIGNIDTVTSANSSNNKWTTHPAFTFGNIELTGIWVAKFEASPAEGVANGYTSDGTCPRWEDNVTTKTIRILPNATSWRCIGVGVAFENARNMENKAIYGWGTTGTGLDTHLMKNTEWGAVAYLSKSKYGKNSDEVWINPAQNYTTGCAGSSASSHSTTTCLNTYDTVNGQKSSTTGNIYGIYDMSGGANEYVAAYLNNANSNYFVKGLDLTSADIKYKNLYTQDLETNNYSATLYSKGDAMYETSSSYGGPYAWFGDRFNSIDNSAIWFARGSAFGNESGAGLFYYANSFGYDFSHTGFRPVLMVDSEL